MQSQLAAGDIRVIGVASLRRSPLTPNLPTLAEQGLPGFEIMNVIGIMAPAGTPQPIVARLNSEIARILTSPESKNFLNTRGNETADDTSAGLMPRTSGRTPRSSSRSSRLRASSRE